MSSPNVGAAAFFHPPKAVHVLDLDADSWARTLSDHILAGRDLHPAEEERTIAAATFSPDIVATQFESLYLSLARKS
jgi:hypothetical protein